MSHCSACSINPIAIYKRGSISHRQRHRICRPGRHVDGADVVALVDGDGGTAIQPCGFKEAGVLCQGEVVDGRGASAACGPANGSSPIAASSEVPILVRCSRKRDAAVSLAVSNPRTRGRSSSTSNGDVSKVNIRHRHSSGCDGAGSANGVAAAETPHGGIGTCGKGESACDGLVRGQRNRLETGRYIARKR